MHGLQVLAAAELVAALTQQDHDIAGRVKRAPYHAIGVLDETDDAKHGRRQHTLAIGLVIKTDVPTGDRDPERAARVAHAFDRASELPHDLRPLRIGEVQAIGRADRLTAGTGDVTRGFGDGKLRTAIRVEIDEAAVAVRGERQRA